MKHKKTHKIYKNIRSVFITGASSGLGKALASAYAKPGIHLFLCGRNEERLNETSKICSEQGAICHIFIFDVTNAESAEKAVQDAQKIFPIDLIIANAGVSAGVLGVPEDGSGTRKIMKTNIEGVVNTVLPAAEIFKKQRFGQIAIVSSIAGYRGMSSCPAYSASKACVKAWGEGLRGLLKPYNIGVSVICPGFIETPLTDKNRFKMPFIMQPKPAARLIRRRLRHNPAIIAFPFIMAFGAWFGSALPSFIILPIMGLFPKKEK